MLGQGRTEIVLEAHLTLEDAAGWLVVLPFELTAASITIEFWRDDIPVAVWVAVFLVFLIVN